MAIDFDSKKLAKQFDDAKTIQREFGNMAKAILARMADLVAAESLADMRALPAAQCHELRGNMLGVLL